MIIDLKKSVIMDNGDGTKQVYFEQGGCSIRIHRCLIHEECEMIEVLSNNLIDANTMFIVTE